MSKSRRFAYDLNFKIKVICFAENCNSNRAAAREFGINESMVRKWRKNESELMSGKIKITAKRMTSGVARPKDQDMEDQLMDWFISQRTRGIAVNSLMIRLKAKQLSSDHNFKASNGWYGRWKTRNGISMRAKTTLAQRMPQDMEDKIVSFHRFVIRLRKRYQYDLHNIFNMDETPMKFELPATRTLSFAGERTVPVKSCGAEKRSFTVTLAVRGDGTKINPWCVFKGKRALNKLTKPPGMHVGVQNKGWMDEEGVKSWVFKNLALPSDQRGLLVWDSFRGHLTEEVKKSLKKRRIDVVVIPGGLTPLLQPLDRCINKPFKDRVKEHYNNWLVKGPFEYTPTGRRRAPSKEIVLQWVDRAWKAISSELVIKSFKVCGITNSMDGSEDEMVGEQVTEKDDGDDDEMDNEFENDSEEEEDYDQ